VVVGTFNWSMIREEEEEEVKEGKIY